MKDIRYDSTNQLSSNNDGNNFRRYNWTEIERVDITDLQMQLKGLKPFTQYEILLQAFNKYGRGPVAKIEAFTAGDGNIITYNLACMEFFLISCTLLKLFGYVICFRLCLVPAIPPHNVNCECKNPKGTSLEISWDKLSQSEARGKLLYVIIYYQNVDEFDPSQGNYYECIIKVSIFYEA